MSEPLQRLLVRLSTLEQSQPTRSPIDPRARIVVCVVYLIVMLSVPIAKLSELILYALYPIICTAEVGVRYGAIARRSLVVVP
ncbi:MAG: cobalt ECF transporter T component CbiQ, partial [Rikenellaceae bacterium]|nr:cobalt ECF transporter T component CbiQ [Rikenellaceae bacterium]